jgi:hypothetical protein
MDFMKSFIVTAFALFGVKEIIFSYLQFKKEYTSDQLKYLYGPIYILLIRSLHCNNRSNQIKNTAEKEYNHDKWAPEVQDKMMQENKECIAKEKEYGDEQVKINFEIEEIITKNFRYTDIDDIPLWENFIKHQLLYQKEVIPNNKLPQRISSFLYKDEKINIFNEDFYNAVKNKFEAKNVSLNKGPLSYCNNKFKTFKYNFFSNKKN